jgi:translation initiation factor 2A
MQFTGDELLIARGGNGRISFYSTTALHASPAAGMAVPSFAAFSISPGPAPYKVAVVQKGAKSKPGSIALYRYPRLAKEDVVGARSVIGADSAEFEWAPDGTAVLATVLSDASDATYYGDTTLVLISADGRSSAELSTGAMVHAVQWCPDSRKFVAITGNSPPKITMYSMSGKPVFSFGSLYRNTVRWSPHGRFLMLGGFGGMAGEVDFWDVTRERRLGTARMNMVSDCKWPALLPSCVLFAPLHVSASGVMILLSHIDRL